MNSVKFAAILTFATLFVSGFSFVKPASATAPGECLFNKATGIASTVGPIPDATENMNDFSFTTDEGKRIKQLRNDTIVISNGPCVKPTLATGTQGGPSTTPAPAVNNAGSNSNAQNWNTLSPTTQSQLTATGFSPSSWASSSPQQRQAALSQLNIGNGSLSPTSTGVGGNVSPIATATGGSATGGNSTLNLTNLQNSDKGEASRAIGQALSNSRVSTETMTQNVITAVNYVGNDSMVLLELAAAYTPAGQEVPCFKSEVINHLAVRLNPSATMISGQLGVQVSAFIQLGNDKVVQRGSIFGTGLALTMQPDLWKIVVTNITSKFQTVTSAVATSSSSSAVVQTAPASGSFVWGQTNLKKGAGPGNSRN